MYDSSSSDSRSLSDGYIALGSTSTVAPTVDPWGMVDLDLPHWQFLNSRHLAVLQVGVRMGGTDTWKLVDTIFHGQALGSKKDLLQYWWSHQADHQDRRTSAKTTLQAYASDALLREATKAVTHGRVQCASWACLHRY